MSKLKIFLISLLIIGVSAFSTCIFLYEYGLKAPSSKSEETLFIVKEGTSNQKIVENLSAEGLLRNKTAASIYFKIHRSITLKAGQYMLNKNMTAREIIQAMSEGKVSEDTVKITFVEGKRLTKYVDMISQGFGYSNEDILATLSDPDYLNELINKYWFLSADILDEKIYYPLEGYLYPDTYQYYSSATIKEIIEKMLDNTDRKLTPYKEAIQNSGYTVHQILAIASIIELEAVSAEDRAMVSQVIYSRLAANMSLGMDVTTYYALQKDMKEELTFQDFATVNAYNTREANPSMAGKLPIGPICNPSIISLEAALNPSPTNYSYFFADVVTGKVYFANTYDEIQAIIKEIG